MSQNRSPRRCTRQMRSVRYLACTATGPARMDQSLQRARPARRVRPRTIARLSLLPNCADHLFALPPPHAARAPATARSAKNTAAPLKATKATASRANDKEQYVLLSERSPFGEVLTQDGRRSTSAATLTTMTPTVRRRAISRLAEVTHFPPSCHFTSTRYEHATQRSMPAHSCLPTPTAFCS
jgi:hypothetical protein